MFRQLLLATDAKKYYQNVIYQNNGGHPTDEVLPRGSEIAVIPDPPPPYYNYIFTNWKNEKDNKIVKFPYKLRRDTVVYADYEWNKNNYRTKKYYKYANWVQPIATKATDNDPDGFSIGQSTFFPTDHYGWKVFDGNASTWWGEQTASAGGWINFYAKFPIKINSLTIKNRNDINQAVNNFTLQASNDNKSWFDLGTGTNPTTTAGGSYTYTVPEGNRGLYLYHRLVVNTFTNHPTIGEINITADHVVDGTESDYDFFEWEYYDRCYYTGQKNFVAVGNDYISISENGETWVQHANEYVETNSLSNVTYGNGKYVAINSDGHVITSEDGETWVQGIGITGSNLNFTGLTYGNGKFVAVGNSGVRGIIATSEDGETWGQIIDSEAALTAVTWGNDKFVAVGKYAINGTNGSVTTSEDGETWDTPIVLTDIKELQCIFWNGQEFGVGGNGKFMRSKNGLIWEIPNQSLANIYSITYGYKKWILGANSGLVFCIYDDGNTSLNFVYQNIGQELWLSAYFDGNIFVMGGYNGGFIISLDGEHWTPYKQMETITQIKAITSNRHLGNYSEFDFYQDYTNYDPYIPYKFFTEYDPNACVIVSSTVRGSLITQDFSLIKFTENPKSSEGFKTVCYGNNLLVGSSKTKPFIATSVDGKTWSNFDVRVQAQDAIIINSITYGNNIFVAAGSMGLLAYSLDNCKTWIVDKVSGINITSYICGAYGNGKFVVGSNSTEIACWDVNAEVTTKKFKSIITQLDVIYGLVHGNDIFVAVGQAAGSTSTIISQNGEDWADASLHYIQGMNMPTSIAYGSGKFVVGDILGNIGVSDDGINWRISSNPLVEGISGKIISIIFNGSEFIACYENGNTIFSYNGVDWESSLYTISKFPNGYDFIPCAMVNVPSVEVFEMGGDWDFYEKQPLPKNLVLVIFNTNGGTPIQNQIIKIDSKLIPVITTKDNYNFVNWTYDEDNKVFDFNMPITKSTTLNANWTPKQYTVTFDVAGGNGSFANQTITYGNKVVNPGNPSKQYYTFKYWTYLGTPFDFNTIITSDITLVATYERALQTQSGSVGVGVLKSGILVQLCGCVVTFPVPFTELINVSVANITVPDSKNDSIADYAGRVTYNSWKSNNGFGQVTGYRVAITESGIVSGTVNWTATGYVN